MPLSWLGNTAEWHSTSSPYLSSVVQDKKTGIPDIILINGPGKYPKEDICLRGEVKSTNVLHSTNKADGDHMETL